MIWTCEIQGTYMEHKDFVTNSYGESWDSSCEKSWVLVQNQWILNWKCLGLYVTRQLIWRHWLRSSVLQYTEFKICPSILIISYLTFASGIIVLLKMPTKCWEFFPILFVKTTEFQLVFNFEQTYTTAQLPYLESMVYSSYTMMAKPIWFSF